MHSLSRHSITYAGGTGNPIYHLEAKYSVEYNKVKREKQMKMTTYYEAAIFRGWSEHEVHQPVPSKYTWLYQKSLC